MFSLKKIPDSADEDTFENAPLLISPIASNNANSNFLFPQNFLLEQRP